MKSVPLALLALFALAVSAYAIAVYGFMPLGAVVNEEMRVNFNAHPVGIYTHVFASALALLLGPLQFWPRLRTSRPAIHRSIGRLYLGVGVLLGGASGLFMALHAFGGPVAKLGFGALAVVWLYTGAQAYLAIRRRDVAAHRRWMMRNFALTLGAVTLRLWLPASAIAGIPFAVAYPVIAWLAWMPNLMIAELLLARRPAAATGAR